MIFGACVGGIPGKQISGQFSREVIKEIRSEVSGNDYSFSADLLEGVSLFTRPYFGPEFPKNNYLFFLFRGGLLITRRGY